ncbi:MAG: hypothetical protein RL514_3499 [Verrucomicrobiota bacterium]|jgi:hypothetical protein
MIQLAPLPQFSGVALGQWAECPLPVRGTDTFHDLYLRVTGQGYGVAGSALDIQHAIESIEIAPSGGSVMTVFPRALRLWQTLRNSNADPSDVSVLAIPLARPGLSQVSDWPTGKMDKCLLRVLPKAALPANSGANPALTLTSISAYSRSEQLAAPADLGAVQSFHQASHTPVAGWNTIDNLSVGQLRALTKLLFYCPLSGVNLTNAASNAVTAVMVYRGKELVYDSTKQIAITELSHNPIYRGYHLGGEALEMFPCIFDVTGRPQDSLGLVAGNVRQTLVVKYYWDTGVAAVQGVNILAEGWLSSGADPVVAAI